MERAKGHVGDFGDAASEMSYQMQIASALRPLTCSRTLRLLTNSTTFINRQQDHETYQYDALLGTFMYKVVVVPTCNEIQPTLPFR